MVPETKEKLKNVVRLVLWRKGVCRCCVCVCVIHGSLLALALSKLQAIATQYPHIIAFCLESLSLLLVLRESKFLWSLQNGHVRRVFRYSGC